MFGSVVLVFVGIYGPYVSDFLQFARLSLIDWVSVLGAALVFLAAFEILKLLKRVKRGRRRAAAAAVGA